MKTDRGGREAFDFHILKLCTIPTIYIYIDGQTENLLQKYFLHTHWEWLWKSPITTIPKEEKKMG